MLNYTHFYGQKGSFYSNRRIPVDPPLVACHSSIIVLCSLLSLIIQNSQANADGKDKDPLKISLILATKYTSFDLWNCVSMWVQLLEVQLLQLKLLTNNTSHFWSYYY